MRRYNQPSSGGNSTFIIIIVIILALLGGLAYYFRDSIGLMFAINKMKNEAAKDKVKPSDLSKRDDITVYSGKKVKESLGEISGRSSGTGLYISKMRLDDCTEKSEDLVFSDTNGCFLREYGPGLHNRWSFDTSCKFAENPDEYLEDVEGYNVVINKNIIDLCERSDELKAQEEAVYAERTQAMLDNPLEVAEEPHILIQEPPTDE